MIWQNKSFAIIALRCRIDKDHDQNADVSVASVEGNRLIRHESGISI